MIGSPLWNTTVTQLMAILREALAALVPIVEKARLPWQDGHAYDDWDAIAMALYDNIVVRSLKHATQGGRHLVLPQYDTLYPSYGAMDIISVERRGVPEGVFIGFAGTNPEFSDVKWVPVAPSGQPTNAGIRLCRQQDCDFGLLLRSNHARRSVHELTVVL